jgi:hypothetical protein
MVTNQEFYCRLEISCFFNIMPEQFVKARCLEIHNNQQYDSITDYDVYSRDFDDYESVIKCLYDIEDIYETKASADNDISSNYCISIYIYNRWESPLHIAMYLNKWMLGGISLLTNEWKENLEKLDRLPNYIWTRMPGDDMDFEECEFISKEKVCLLLNEWLEIGKCNKDLTYRQHNDYMNEFRNSLTNKNSSL